MNMSTTAYANLKEYAIKWFKDESLNILPSIVLAYSIIKLDKLSETTATALMECNNPFAIEAGRKYKGKVIKDEETGKKYKTYFSMDEFADFALGHEGQYATGLYKIKGFINYDIALEKLHKFYGNDRINIADMRITITAYGLDNVDIEMLEELYPAKGKVIIDGVEPTGSSVVETSPVIAKQPDKTVKKAVVLSGNRLHNDTKVEERKVAFVKGEKIFLKNANLFNSVTSKRPTRSISGVYYLTNGVMTNFRYAIVAKKDFVGDSKFNIGFVRKEDIK